ncbi:MAG: RnfH family protein [Burkholderiaceae bacterium]|jgi:putative ubiquitin-RnfH superfamily antitoxin RatB of RatAB toxin-antitoxin module
MDSATKSGEAGAALLTVSVVYALPGRAVARTVRLAPGSRVGEAIEASGIPKEAGLDLSDHSVGVYGRVCTLEEPLCDHDRVEIYRALPAAPNEARLRRAVKKVRKS